MRTTRSLRVLLAGVALLQGIGLLLTCLREGTAVGTWLFLELLWPEHASILFERAASLTAVLGIALAAISSRRGLRLAGGLLAAGWFALLAIAKWPVGGAPFTQWALLAHATRIAAPLVLCLWDRPKALAWTLRSAVGLTFLVHGMEALQLHPRFVDFLLAADLRLFGLGLTESTANVLLRIIGAIDVAGAALILSGRDLRPVLYWATAWGFVTALSRVVQGGEGALHQTLIRAANGGLPLILLFTSRSTSMTHPPLHALSQRLGRAALPLVAIAALLPATGFAQALQGANPGHLRVVWTEDPAHEATVSWSTLGGGTTHEVYFDTQPRSGTLGAYAQKVAATRNGGYETGGASYHHAFLSGLTPDTTYYFVVVSDGVASPERHFRTGHADDRDFRLLSGGDSRSSATDRRAMNQRMAAMAEADPGIVALVHGGDYIETPTSWSEWNDWMADHAESFTADGRVIPLIPTRGNHEGDGVMFNQVFGFPGGDDVDYFASQLGAAVRLIILDTNVSIGGDQTVWLEQQLQNANQEARWIIPGYHRPAFPAVKTPSGARQFWVPLFEEFNVDVVLESDGHVLKRTLPIRNDQPDPTGIVYVGEGGLGVPQREPVDQWYLEAPGMATSAHHVQRFSFSPEALVYEARLMDGSVADTWTFQPRRTVEVDPPVPTPPDGHHGEPDPGPVPGDPADPADPGSPADPSRPGPAIDDPTAPGCAAAGATLGWLALAGVAVVVRRRRRGHAPRPA